MSEVVLGLVIAALLVYIYLKEHKGEQERKNLINAIIAKNAQEKANLDMASNQTPTPESRPDIVPLEDASDSEWEDAALGRQPY